MWRLKILNKSNRQSVVGFTESFFWNTFLHHISCHPCKASNEMAVMSYDLEIIAYICVHLAYYELAIGDGTLLLHIVEWKLRKLSLEDMKYRHISE